MQTADMCQKAGAAAVEVYPCDGTDAKGIDELCQVLLDKHKCIDVVVHSAGIFPMTGQTPLEGMPMLAAAAFTNSAASNYENICTLVASELAMLIC